MNKMIMHSVSRLFHLCTILLLLHSNIHSVDAFPGAAGHCSTGDLAGKGSPHGEDGGGAISNGSLRVTFDSTSLTSFTTATLNAFQEYTVTLDFNPGSTGFFYRGFLFRLSGKGGQDVEGSFYVDGTDSNVQTKSGCATGISAMTHTNRDDKTSVSFKFQYTESANADLLLEVTTLRQKEGNDWFYTPFNIQIGSDQTAPPATSAPTSSPSEAPSPSSSEVSTCNDTNLKFGTKNYYTKKRIWRNCSWVAAKSTNFRCANFPGVSTSCPATCGTCDTCVDSDARIKVKRDDNSVITRDCTWVNNKPYRCDAFANIKDTCRKTCGVC
jgi:hypothetical protein